MFKKYKSEIKNNGYTHIKSFYEKNDILVSIEHNINRIIESVCFNFLGEKITLKGLDDPETVKIITLMQKKHRNLISIIYDASL